MFIRIAIWGMAFANGQGIVACLPFPVSSHSHSHSLKNSLGGGVNHSSYDFPAKKQETEQVVRNRMEEQTARKKQAEAWGVALLVSAQNMGIPAHSSSVPVSAVGAGVAQQSLILPSVQYDSEAEVGEKRPAPDSAQELPGPSVGVLPLHMIEEETAGEDSDHAEKTPSSPPCSGQQLSAEQYRMNTPAKAARGGSDYQT